MFNTSQLFNRIILKEKYESITNDSSDVDYDIMRLKWQRRSDTE